MPEANIGVGVTKKAHGRGQAAQTTRRALDGTTRDAHRTGVAQQ